MMRACLLPVCLAATVLAASASARTLHYQVTVVVNGPGHVTGTGDGGSIDCPGTCSALIKQNTAITLTATPDGGATFGGWGGDCAPSGTGLSCTLTMDGQGSNGSKGVTAGFGAAPPPPPLVKLEVSKTGTGAGYVGGGGIDCGKGCAKSLVKGTKVELFAVPTGPAAFLGWRAPCSGTGRCSLTVNEDTTVTAVFADSRRPYIATLPGSVARGRATFLRFRVWDRTGKSREELTVRRGAETIAHAKVPMRAVAFRRMYGVRWLVPRSAPRGKARYCAVAVDQAGKRSPTACSPLTIS